MIAMIEYKLLVPGLAMTLMVSEVNHAVSSLTLASGMLDCESDEQQMATQEWCIDASALRPSEAHNNSGVMIVKHFSTSLQLSLVTLRLCSEVLWWHLIELLAFRNYCTSCRLRKLVGSQQQLFPNSQCPH